MLLGLFLWAGTKAKFRYCVGLFVVLVTLAENAFAEDYLGYVRDPANGCIAQTMPIEEGRGNEMAVRVR